MTIVHRRGALAAALLLALSLLAGCGSTNKADTSAGQPKDDEAGEVAVDTDAAGGEDAPAPPGEGVAAGSGQGSAAAGSPATRGTAAKPAAGTAASTGGASGGKVAPASAKVSPGVTATEMAIGVIRAENAGAANAAFGYAGIGQIDGRKVWEAVLAEVNKTGGVAGRKLKPIWYVLDGTDFQTTTDTHYQRACARWTEDNKVFAVMAADAGQVLSACLAKKGGVPQVTATGGPDAETRAKYPRYFAASGIASDRLMRVVADRLHARGYYKGAKLGVVVYTQPAYERAARVLYEELARRDVRPAQVATIKPRPNVAGANDEIAAIRSAVLKFKTENVTHVQFVSDNSAWVQLNFMKAAQEQQYFPKYGLSSNDGGMALAQLLGPDARTQLRGAVGVGWFPVFDVRAQDNPDSPALARCKKIARDAGQEFSDPTRNTEAQAASICDQVFFLKQAAELGLPDLTYEAFRLGGEQVKGFPAALTFRASMSPSRHDGVGAIRLTEWFTDCDCFKYVSGEQPV